MTPLHWTGIAIAAVLASIALWLWLWHEPRVRASDAERPTGYHFHDKGPGPWLSRVTGFDFRYVACEGTPEGCAVSAFNCNVLGVAATRFGVRRVVRKRQRDGRQPFYEYPPERVTP